MKLIILAFILSLSLHFLFISKLNEKKEIQERPSTSKEVKKSSVNFVRILPKVQKKQSPKTKEKVEAKIEKKAAIKPTPKEYKKIEIKKIVPQKRKIVAKAKKPKIIIPKPIKKVEVKPNPTKQVPKKNVKIKPQEKRKTIPKKSLENFLLAEPLPLDRDMLDDITKSYLNLYGEEYNSFTKVQKVYLQKNLKNIGKITQKYLRYPSISVRTGQQGMNIVEFFLHPNGDISELKLVNSSSYSALDKNSIETIEIAYKDYPRPKVKTKIKIYVYYKLY